MPTKEVIPNKISNLFSNIFKTPSAAFAGFDTAKDETLTKNNVSELIKQTEASGQICGLSTNKSIESYNKDSDGLVKWGDSRVAIEEIRK